MYFPRVWVWLSFRTRWFGLCRKLVWLTDCTDGVSREGCANCRPGSKSDGGCGVSGCTEAGCRLLALLTSVWKPARGLESSYRLVIPMSTGGRAIDSFLKYLHTCWTQVGGVMCAAALGRMRTSFCSERLQHSSTGLYTQHVASWESTSVNFFSVTCLQ